MKKNEKKNVADGKVLPPNRLPQQQQPVSSTSLASSVTTIRQNQNNSLPSNNNNSNNNISNNQPSSSTTTSTLNNNSQTPTLTDEETIARGRSRVADYQKYIVKMTNLFEHIPQVATVQAALNELRTLVSERILISFCFCVEIQQCI